MKSGRAWPRIQIAVDQLGDHVLRHLLQVCVRRAIADARFHGWIVRAHAIPLRFVAMLRRLLLTLTFLVAAIAHAAPRRVDIVITGGTVITMAGPNLDDGAVAIDKGDIVA